MIACLFDSTRAFTAPGNFLKIRRMCQVPRHTVNFSVLLVYVCS